MEILVILICRKRAERFQQLCLYSNLGFGFLCKLDCRRANYGHKMNALDMQGITIICYNSL